MKYSCILQKLVVSLVFAAVLISVRSQASTPNRLVTFEQAMGSLGGAKSRAEGDARQVVYSPFIAKEDAARIELEYNKAKSIYDGIITQLNASLADSDKKASPPQFTEAQAALNLFAKDAETTITSAAMIVGETQITGGKASSSPWDAIGTAVVKAIDTVWKNIHAANEDKRKAMMALVKETSWSPWESLKLPGLTPSPSPEGTPGKKPK